MTRWSVEIADVQYWQRNIPCQEACPVRTDARGYVRAIADGDFERAYLLARGPNPLASMCGRICGAPCEEKCRRGDIDRPIAIRALKRFVDDRYGPWATAKVDGEVVRGRLDALRAGGACDGIDDVRHLLERFKQMDFPQPRGERVAVIGSGVAGLACGHDLALMGFRPVIYEAEPVAAGMMYIGVPEYRLPRDVIAAEVGMIEALGVEIRCGVEVGTDVGLDEILSEYKAVVIAVGAKKSRRLPAPGVEGPDVLGGVELLRDMAYDRPVELGRRVVVIGGGSVAYDAARTVLRQTYLDISRAVKRRHTVEETHLVCLESLAEMPAEDTDILDGDAEGVLRQCGWGPTQVLRDSDGKVTGVEFQRCLKTYDEQGRFAPVFDAADRMTIECDTVIITIGQAMELSFVDPERDGIRMTERGAIEVNRDTLATSRPGVFLAGDVALGVGLMIHAIALGKRAARSVYRYLTGEEASHELTDFHRVLAGYAREWDFEVIERVKIPKVPAAERIMKQRATVEIGYDEEMAVREASRCLECGVNTIFDGTKCILCGGCVGLRPMGVKIRPVGGNAGPRPVGQNQRQMQNALSTRPARHREQASLKRMAFSDNSDLLGKVADVGSV